MGIALLVCLRSRGIASERGVLGLCRLPRQRAAMTRRVPAFIGTLPHLTMSCLMLLEIPMGRQEENVGGSSQPVGHCSATAAALLRLALARAATGQTTSPSWTARRSARWTPTAQVTCTRRASNFATFTIRTRARRSIQAGSTGAPLTGSATLALRHHPPSQRPHPPPRHPDHPQLHHPHHSQPGLRVGVLCACPGSLMQVMVTT